MLKCKVCGKEKLKSLVNHFNASEDHPPWEEYKKRHPNAKAMVEEVREKISGENNPSSGIDMSGENNPFFGKHHSKETKKKMSEARKEWWQKHPEQKKRLRERLKDRNKSWSKEKEKERRRKISKAMKEKWQDIEFRRRRLKKIRKGKPTDIERRFISICEKFNLPYKYVGDGKFWVSNMNPDFLNTNNKKIVVEILGEYWHNPKEFEKRKNSSKSMVLLVLESGDTK